MIIRDHPTEIILLFCCVKFQEGHLPCQLTKAEEEKYDTKCTRRKVIMVGIIGPV